MTSSVYRVGWSTASVYGLAVILCFIAEHGTDSSFRDPSVSVSAVWRVAALPLGGVTRVGCQLRTVSVTSGSGFFTAHVPPSVRLSERSIYHKSRTDVGPIRTATRLYNVEKSYAGIRSCIVDADGRIAIGDQTQPSKQCLGLLRRMRQIRIALGAHS